MSNVPIVLIAFNRPDHLRRTLESLERNKGAARSRLFAFLDGPRDEKDVAAVKAVRKVVEERRWCGSVEIIAREKNLGCARSTIDGVTTVCRDAGRVIALDDDLDLSPWFLEFIEAALDRYAETEKVMHISGYMYPVESQQPQRALCLPILSPWGWGTWWRAWQHYDTEFVGYKALVRDENLRREFDLDGYFPQFHLLESSLCGKIDSWATRWYLTLFMRRALSLFPSVSLVKNTGFDGSGLHCSADFARPEDHLANLPLRKFPETIEVDEAVLAQVREHLRQSWPAPPRRGIARRLAQVRDYFSKTWCQQKKLYR